MRDDRNVFRNFREKHVLTQAELATFLDVAQQTMCIWEKDPAHAPAWAKEACEDPRMPPEYLARRLRSAKLITIMRYGHTAEEAEDMLREREMPFRAWRRARGMTQAQAAAALGIPVGTAKALDWGARIPDEIRERMEKK